MSKALVKKALELLSDNEDESGMKIKEKRNCKYFESKLSSIFFLFLIFFYLTLYLI